MNELRGRGFDHRVHRREIVWYAEGNGRLALGGGAAGAAAVETAVAEGDAAGVAPAATPAVQRPAAYRPGIGSPLTCSTSESRVVCSPPSVKPAQLPRRSIAPTGVPIGLSHSGFLCSNGSSPRSAAVVVFADGGLQCPGRKADLGFEFVDRLADPRRPAV